MTNYKVIPCILLIDPLHSKDVDHGSNGQLNEGGISHEKIHLFFSCGLFATCAICL